MKTIVQRIREIARDLKIGEGRFETSIGVSVGYLNITEKRSGDPGVSVVKNIIETYPEYSLGWIFSGEGTMKVDDLETLNEPTTVYLNQVKSVEASLIALIKKVVIEEVDPKIESIHDSIMRLMKRDLELIKTEASKKESNHS